MIALSPARLACLPLMAAALTLLGCEEAALETKVSVLRLADGDFDGLAWGGTQVERFHVLARDRATDDVFLYSPDYPEPCNLGPLSWYGPYAPSNSGPYALRSPSPARIPIFETQDQDGIGTLKFVGLDCQRSSFEAPNASPRQVWRLKPPDPTQLMFALREPDRSLVFLDPWKRERRPVAEAVDDVESSSVGVRLIEDGRATVRDFEGKLLARFGTGVEWVMTLDTTTLLYRDARGIWLRRAQDEAKLATDACAFDALSSSPPALAYYSPCDTRTLVVRTLDGEPIVVAAGVEEFQSYGDLLLFTQQSESGGVRLSFARGSEDYEAQTVAELEALALDRILYVTRNDVLFTTTADDGSIAVQRVRIDREEPTLESVQERVVALRSDGETFGTLDADGVLTVRTLVGLHTRLRLRGVAERGFSYTFGNRSVGLAYMTKWNEEAKLGRLELRFLDLDDHFVVAENVREYREVWWPEPGLVFATGGNDPGIHFARVEIPCENTSDAPWSCSF